MNAPFEEKRVTALVKAAIAPEVGTPLFKGAPFGNRNAAKDYADKSGAAAILHGEKAAAASFQGRSSLAAKHRDAQALHQKAASTFAVAVTHYDERRDVAGHSALARGTDYAEQAKALVSKFKLDN